VERKFTKRLESKEEKKERESRDGTVFLTREMKQCRKLYDNPPWIEQETERLLIGEERRMIKNIRQFFESRFDSIEMNNKVYFRPNNKFFELFCNSKRIQVDNNYLEITDYKGDKFKFMIGYETKDGDVIQQDRYIYNKEKAYFERTRMSRQEKIAEILDEEPDSSVIREAGISFLSSQLTTVAPKVSDYERDNSTYVTTAIEKLVKMSRNVREFATRLGQTVVYLYPIIFSLGDQIFLERVKAEYYLPDVLVTLTPQQKMPEIFDENLQGSDERARKVLNIIDRQVEIFVNRFGDRVYSMRNPTERHTFIQRPTVIETFTPLPNWREVCANDSHGDMNVRDIPKEDLTHYKDENGKVYCFSISILREQFKDENIPSEERFVNEFTGNDFSIEFISNFIRDFPGKDVVRQYVEFPLASASKLSARESVSLAPGLIELILEDIANMENEREEEESEEDERSKGYDDYDEKENLEELSYGDISDSQERELVETDEDEDEKLLSSFNDSSEEEEEIDSKDLNSFFDDSSEKDSFTDSETSSSSESEDESEEDEYCTHCKKLLKGPDIQTSIIKERNGGIKVVKFCDIECFTNEDRVWK
jgi:hypothetical protein